MSFLSKPGMNNTELWVTDWSIRGTVCMDSGRKGLKGRKAVWQNVAIVAGPVSRTIWKELQGLSEKWLH